MGTKYISRKRNRRGNLVKYRDDRLVCAQQSTGAAQIANLKYILKNGSTGEFVEALDSIINERVRVALGTLVNNLDKGTGLAKVLGIDSSNDLGASSLANLASMLSAEVPIYSNVNIDNLPDGLCFITTGATSGGSPVGYTYFFLETKSWSAADVKFQRLINISGSGDPCSVLYRAKNNIWSIWKTVSLY